VKLRSYTVGPTASPPSPSDKTTGRKSISRAMSLRLEGMTYKSISIAMRLYHDDDRSEEAWRNLLRSCGAPRSRRGLPRR
jgi:hypothetical protein